MLVIVYLHVTGNRQVLIFDTKLTVLEVSLKVVFERGSADQGAAPACEKRALNNSKA